jgi:hypothetical protein
VKGIQTLESPLLCQTIEGVGGEDTTGNIKTLLRQSSKEGVSDVCGEEESLTCEDDVSDVGNVGFSEDSPKPPADCNNEMGEAITSIVVIGAQKIHDNNTNTNNLDFIFSHYPSKPL